MGNFHIRRPPLPKEYLKDIDQKNDAILLEILLEKLVLFPEFKDKQFVDSEFNKWRETTFDELRWERGVLIRKRPEHRKSNVTFLGYHLLPLLMKKHRITDQEKIAESLKEKPIDGVQKFTNSSERR